MYPTGTVTFLFTDMEGSTTLWENYPTRMPKVVERHDEILRNAVDEYGGYVFKTVGDAFHAVFSNPREALRAALAAQRALFAEKWSRGINLRVRIALHTGFAEQEREGDYLGPAVNRVSRLLGAGHGGQILVSSSTHDQVCDHPELIDEGARFIDIGEHRLKDLTRPWRVFQLAVPDLPEKFSPLTTHEVPEDERYRIKGFLGSGGMAKVYVAHDERLDRDVAMKVLHPRYVDEEEFIERFDREARSTAKLSHPNIVSVYDQGHKDDGTYYIVMEYLPKGTLKDLILREGPLPPRTVVELALQIARALETAHEEGVVHRDMKPQNILLTKRGEAKVADFGIAKAASESTLTRQGATLGTPQYLSPEIIEGERADVRSDLYSLGVVFYEMLTGELPFDAETPAAIMMKHLHGQLSPPKEINSEVPEQVEAVVVRLLARDPEDRYPHATALAGDLERLSYSLREKDQGGGLVGRPASHPAAKKEEAFTGTVVGGTEASSVVQVPDLTGDDCFLASSKLTNQGLKLGDQREAPSEAISEGQVIGQTPEAGKKVKRDCMVNVTVSSGPEESTTVPDISGSSLEEARRALEEAGLVLASSQKKKKSLKSAGTIVSTDPSAGSKVALGVSINPTVSSGLALAPWVLIAALIAAVLVGGSAIRLTVVGGGSSLGDPLIGSPTATIVSDFALQGASRPQNITIDNAITMALEERDYMAGDVRIQYESQDNATAQAGKWDEATCVENAQSAAQDENIVGWIGPGNSGCAAVEIPILNQAGLAMVSPATTALGLTKPGSEPDEPEKYYPTGNRNFTRVVITDDKQGRAAAVWMNDFLDVDSVYILDDEETYGMGVADQFQRSAREMGVDVLGRESIDRDAANYRDLMARISQEKPDAIYFGGIAENNAGQLVKDKLRAGMSNEDVIFMGPDGLRKEAFLEAAGDEAENTYVTFGGLPPNLLPDKGQDFVERYEERFGSVETYTVHGYEAANVMLDAIQRAYEADGEVTREGVMRELLATQDYDGALGTWSFDEDGDTSLSQLSGQRIENGEFTFDLDRAIDVAI